MDQHETNANAIPAGEAGNSTPATPKTLYQQDLEERARLRETTVEEIYRHDQELLSRPQPSEQCLRPDEIMECAADPERLTRRSWEHFQSCEYCRGLVAFAKPNAERASKMARHLAGLADESARQATPASPRLVRWTDGVMGGVDRTFTTLWRNSPILAGCCLLIYFGSPDWLRTRTPVSIWTDHQLRQSAARVLEKGNSPEAYRLANELIRRDPGNLNGRRLRYQALVEQGKKAQAEKEAGHLVDDLMNSMEPKDRVAALDTILSSLAWQGSGNSHDEDSIRLKRKVIETLQKDVSRSMALRESSISKEP